MGHNANAIAQPDDNDGIFGLPIVGAPLRVARDVYRDLEPTEDDGLEVVIAKETLRYTTVVAAAALTVLAIF